MVRVRGVFVLAALFAGLTIHMLGLHLPAGLPRVLMALAVNVVASLLSVEAVVRLQAADVHAACRYRLPALNKWPARWLGWAPSLATFALSAWANTLTDPAAHGIALVVLYAAGALCIVVVPHLTRWGVVCAAHRAQTFGAPSPTYRARTATPPDRASAQWPAGDSYSPPTPDRRLLR